MKIEELLEFLVTKIIKNKDSLAIRKYEEDDYTSIEVLVDEKDMGLIIGKNGIIANSIRTIVQAAAYSNSLKKVKINFDSF